MAKLLRDGEGEREKRARRGEDGGVDTEVGKDITALAKRGSKNGGRDGKSAKRAIELLYVIIIIQILFLSYSVIIVRRDRR